MLLGDSTLTTQVYPHKSKNRRSRQCVHQSPQGLDSTSRATSPTVWKRIDAQIGCPDRNSDAVAGRRGVTAPETALRYGLIIGDLVSYQESLSQVTSDSTLSDSLSAAAHSPKAKALLGDEEAAVYPALVSGTLDSQQFSSFIATLTGQQEAMIAFSLTADSDQNAIVGTTITGDALQLADDVATELTRSAGNRARVSPRRTRPTL